MSEVLVKTCLIIDDEPLAREILRDYISRVPSLTLVASCKNAISALPYLNNKSIDILFCDIKMPEVNGLELIKTLNTKPAIIFTTAYSEYAVEGFEIGVTDYLVKPIRFERFLKAVGRAFGHTDQVQSGETEKINDRNSHLYFKLNGEFIKVEILSIHYIEAYGNYVKIHQGARPLIVHEKISVLEEILAPYSFMRVHKSFIIPRNRVKDLVNNEVLLEGGKTIPIGSFYKKEFLNSMTRK